MGFLMILVDANFNLLGDKKKIGAYFKFFNKLNFIITYYGRKVM
jgi:hypothetical protein